MIILLITAIATLDNGLGITPPMGWNSWNKFHCSINQTLVKQTADLLVSTGLAKLGYVYLNLDDCWQASRNKETKKIVQSKNFPSGIPSLAKYVHSKGLKFGLYSDAGFKTCQGKPGSLHYQTIDAQTYAQWEVDYLKYDNCFNDGSSPKKRYPPMSAALNKTGRHIYFSICQWGRYNPAQWAGQYGNSWRTTGDIKDSWDSFIKILDHQIGLQDYAGPGHWNDPDMLQVGNGGMTTDEYQAHFGLWALLKAPLLIGCDLSNMSNETMNILGNQEVIAINQDQLGKQGHILQKTKNSSKQIWFGQISHKRIAVILFNRDEKQPQNFTINFSQLGIKTKLVLIRDIINKKDIGRIQSEYSIQNIKPHSIRMFTLKYQFQLQQ